MPVLLNSDPYSKMGKPSKTDLELEYQILKSLQDDGLDYRKRIEKNQMILTEEDGLQPLGFEPQQHRILDAIEESRRRSGRVRLWILKPRRMRCSTALQGWAFDRGLHSEQPGQCYTLANDQRVKTEMFDMVDRYRKHYGEEAIDYLTRRRPTEIKLTNDYQFSFDILSDYAGSSSTLMVVIATEVAKAKGAKNAMDSVMPAARMADVIGESTANGQLGDGKFFYDRWKLASSGNSAWLGLFMGWQEHPHYLIPQTDQRFEELMNEPLSREEQELQKAYKLKDEQLAWRRDVITTECGGDADFFRQDYPSNPDEAFLKVEGKRVFDMSLTRTNRTKAKPPIATGFLRWKKGRAPKRNSEGDCTNKRRLAVEFVPDESGDLRIWQWPDEDWNNYRNRYLIPGDVAEGVEGGDASSSAVLDRHNREWVAALHGQWDPTVFGRNMVMLALFYGRGTVCPEINSIGNATMKECERLYDNLWDSVKDVPGDPDEQDEEGKLGHRTTNTNVLAEAFRDVMREDLWYDPDELFWSEALNVVRKKNGRPNLNGMDRTVVRCIGALIDTMMSPVYVKRPEREQEPDYGNNKRFPDREDEVKDGEFVTADYDGEEGSNWMIAGLQ